MRQMSISAAAFYRLHRTDLHQWNRTTGEENGDQQERFSSPYVRIGTQ